MSHLLTKMLLSATLGLLTALLIPTETIDAKTILVMSLALVASLLEGIRLLKEGKYSDETVLKVAAVNVLMAMCLMVAGNRIGCDLTVAVAAIFGYEIHRRLLKIFQRL